MVNAYGNAALNMGCMHIQVLSQLAGSLRLQGIGSVKHAKLQTLARSDQIAMLAYTKLGLNPNGDHSRFNVCPGVFVIF